MNKRSRLVLSWTTAVFIAIASAYTIFLIHFWKGAVAAELFGLLILVGGPLSLLFLSPVIALLLFLPSISLFILAVFLMCRDGPILQILGYLLAASVWGGSGFLAAMIVAIDL